MFQQNFRETFSRDSKAKHEVIALGMLEIAYFKVYYRLLII
jgi:hypothetical protein